jgi:hypothetical protein
MAGVTSTSTSNTDGNSSEVSTGIEETLVAREIAKRQAKELYRTTRLSVRAIATPVGGSRMTVHRWQHRGDTPVGRDANNDPAS